MVIQAIKRTPPSQSLSLTHHSQPCQTESDKVTLASLNCNSLGDRRKTARVLDYVSTQNKDFFALIDTRTDNKSEYNIKSKCKGRVFCIHGTSNSKGLILIVHQRLTDIKITHEILHQGQISKFSYKINDRQYNLLVVYGPSDKDDHKFFSQ